MIFPVFFVFKYLLKSKSFKIIKSRSSDPLKVDSFVMVNGTNLKMLVVNFTSADQHIRINNCTSDITIKQLNAESFVKAATDSNWIENAFITKVIQNECFDLAPFSVSFIYGNINV